MNTKNLLLEILVVFFINSLLFADGIPEMTNTNYSWIEVGGELNLNCLINGMTSTIDGKVFIGSAGEGTFLNSDNGMTWKKKPMGDVGHDNGITTVIFAHPNGKIYAGQSNGFVFVSNDSGETFETLCSFSSDDPRPVSFADDILGNVYFVYSSGESKIYTPENTNMKSNNVVYFNTPVWSMEVDKQGFMFISTMGEGIFKSSDRGDNWEKINTGLPDLDVHKVIAAENDVLFAGLSGDGGFYKSTDRGQSWQASMNGMGSLIVMDIIFGKNKTIFAATTKDIFRSDDFGENWISIKGDLPGLTNYRRLTLDKKNYLYIGSLPGRIYRTRDPVEAENDYLSLQVEPLNPVTIAPGKSFDYTITVKDFVNLPVENANIFIEEDVTGNSQTIGTNNEGIVNFSLFIPPSTKPGDYPVKFAVSKSGYKSSDTITRIVQVRHEDSWAKVQSYNYNKRILSILTIGNDKIFLGTAGGSLIASTNSGQSWFYSSNGLSQMNSIYKIEKDSDGSIFLATDWDGIVKSTDFGMSWTKLNTGFERTSNFAIGSNGVMYAFDFNGAMVRSTDKGATWQVPLAYHDSIKTISDVLALNNSVFIAASNPGLFYSSNNGDNWEQRTWGIELLSVNSISKDKAGNYYLGTGDNGVFKSTDNGLIWQMMNNGISDFNIKKIVTDKDQLFVSAFGKGVWYSSFQGYTWEEFNDGLEGLSFIDVYGMAVSEDGYIYAGAFDKGLYKRKNPITEPTSVKHEINNACNLKVFPNPIINDAIISYDNPKNETVELSVYNILGNKVVELPNNSFETGTQYIRWNTNGLAGGVYILKLLKGNTTTTKCVIINK